MKFLKFCVPFLFINTAFALDVGLKIKADTHINFMGPITKTDKTFPAYEYMGFRVMLRNPYFKGDDENKIRTIYNSDTILLDFHMKLIDFDDKQNKYKFCLYVTSVTFLFNDKVQHKKAKVHFYDSPTTKLLLEGKFKKQIVTEFGYPEIDRASEDDIMLSLNVYKDITLSTQHDIPITLELDD